MAGGLITARELVEEVADHLRDGLDRIAPDDPDRPMLLGAHALLERAHGRGLRAADEGEVD